MNDMVLSHLHDLARRGGVGSFLSPAEAAQAKGIFGSRIALEGGFVPAERVLPIFSADYDPEALLCGIALRFRPQDPLTHRDILGAVLALGIERSVVGDIHVAQGQAHLVCLPQICEFLLEHLCKAGKTGLRAEQIPLSALPHPVKELRQVSCTVASLRLDAVLAAAFHCSRGAAEEYLRMGLVRLCHEECRSGTKQVPEGAVIALRGKGRVTLLALEGESRKGRLRIVLGFDC